MSLLTICKSVLAETGWPVLGTIASNSDGTAQQIMAIANTELRALSEQFSWPHLQVEYPFATVAGQRVYLWPADFRVLLPQSVFNASEYYELKGSTGQQFWELLKYGKLDALNRARFRVTYPLGLPGIEMTPAPSGVQQLIAVYDSNQYVRSETGVSAPVYMSDNDVAKIPERYVELGVKWRFRRAKGLDFSAELAEYNATVQTQFAKYTSQGEIQIGGRRPMYDAPHGYIRDTGFGA
jgi:hypothetical protein